MATVKRGIPLALSALVLELALMAVPARADDVTFFDSTDTIKAGTTASDPTNPRITIGTCGNTESYYGALVEVCSASVSPFTSNLLARSTGIVGIAEADGTLSDFLSVAVSTEAGLPAEIQFVSVLSGGAIPLGIPLTCSDFGYCKFTEDGTVQFGDRIDWIDPLSGAFIASDYINFQSDLDAPVPEPASLVLLGGGCLAVAGYVKRRRLA